MIYIDDKIEKLISIAEEQIKKQFEKIDKIAQKNSLKVLNAFQNNKVAEVHFQSTTGYGYGDIGRDTIEKYIVIYSKQKIV